MDFDELLNNIRKSIEDLFLPVKGYNKFLTEELLKEVIESREQNKELYKNKSYTVNGMTHTDKLTTLPNGMIVRRYEGHEYPKGRGSYWLVEDKNGEKIVYYTNNK